MFIAHRGNNGSGYKENTVSAFINCFNTSYIDGVEMDVRLTRDNVVVVSHGDLFDGKVISKTKYSKLGIDSLDYVLSCLSNKKKIIIDIKGNDLSIVDRLYSVLIKYDYQFYVCSFNNDIVSLFKKKYSSYKVGLIIGYMINIDRIHNDFDFNLLHYNLYKKVGHRETFLWTVNDRFIYDIVKKYSSLIITDKAYLLH